MVAHVFAYVLTPAIMTGKKKCKRKVTWPHVDNDDEYGLQIKNLCVMN